MARQQTNITTTLLYSLAIISLIGFLTIILDSYFNSNFLKETQTAWILIVLGVGFAIEGQIRKWKNFRKDGFNSNELTHIITGLVGIISVLFGILSLVIPNSPVISASIGLISILAFIIIILEVWVAK